MTNSRWISLLVLALALVLAPAAIADEEMEIETKVQIVKGDDKVAFELDEMAEGESRHFTSDQGRPVEVTRTAEGYRVDFDGREIPIPLGGEGHGYHMHHAHGEEGESHDVVIVKKGEEAHEGEGGHHVFLFSDEEGEGEAGMIKKRIVTCVGDGEDDCKVEVRIHPAGEGEELGEGMIEHELETGDGNVVVIKKRIEKQVETEGGEGDGERIEVKVERKVKSRSE